MIYKITIHHTKNPPFFVRYLFSSNQTRKLGKTSQLY